MNMKANRIPIVDYRPKPPIKKDYGIGIIGAGIITNIGHAPAYRNAGFNIVGIADINKSNLEKTCQDWSIEHGYDDYRKLLQRDDIDIIDICVGHKGRVQMVKDCAAAGKHIMIQKPFAHKFGDALAMVDAAEEAGVKFIVNQSCRYSPVFIAAKQLMDQGWIGEPFLFQFSQNLNSDGIDEGHWFQDLNNFVLIEATVHYIDIMRFWAGREVKNVSASLTCRPGQMSKGELVASMKIDFGDGLNAMLCDNSGTVADDQGMRYRIDGGEGIIKGGYDFGPSKELIMYNEHVELFSRLLPDAWYKPAIRSHYYPDAFAGPMGEFMDSITEDRTSILRARDNLNTLRVALAGYISAVENRVVSPDEVDINSKPYGKFGSLSNQSIAAKV